MKKINSGCEANIYEIKKNILRKKRLKKNYRIKILDDKIRKKRNRCEFRILKKLYENKINVPQPIFLDEKKFFFDMEKINGKLIFDKINFESLKKIILQISKIHNLNIIHNDLTTKNILISNEKIFFIDFGLSFHSSKIEDKAVDLDLFFSCIKNFHNKFYGEIKFLEKIYLKKTFMGKEILERLKIVEMRGRNKKK